MKAWDAHDLDGVVEPFDEDVVFEHWTGAVIGGKKELVAAWRRWFDEQSGFLFVKEDIFIDETGQKALFRWTYEGPAFGRKHKGKKEVRRGVDLLYFRDGKIVEKLVYSKTSIEIDGKMSMEED